MLASGQNDPAYLAVDNGTVYWADSSAGTVMAVPVTGGSPTVVASGQPDPAYLTATAGVVYWVDQGIHTIMESAESGGTPAPLVSDPGGPAYLAADSGYLYWADSDPGQVMAIRTTGLRHPVCGGRRRCRPGLRDREQRRRVLDRLVSGAILKVTVTDGVPSPPAVLASDQNGPAYVAVNSGTVYWIDGRRPRSWRSPQPAAPRLRSPVASPGRHTWR